jgi:hypothetical protein
MDKQWISYLMDKQSPYVLEKEDQRFCSKNCPNKTILQLAEISPIRSLNVTALELYLKLQLQLQAITIPITITITITGTLF